MIIDAFKKTKFKHMGTQYDNEVDKFINEHAQIRINNELFPKNFKCSELVDMAKKLLNIKDKDENNDLVNVIKSGLKDLKEEIKEMSKEEREIEKPDKRVEIVEEILMFNEQQEGKELKILRPNQMLSILPISLAQLQAGNNSQKPKNEIRQLLYSLYHSKTITKQVYNNLIKYI